MKQLVAARVVAVGEHHQHRRSDEWRHGGAARGFPSVRPTVPAHPSSLKDLHALPYPFLGGNSQRGGKVKVKEKRKPGKVEGEVEECQNERVGWDGKTHQGGDG